MSEEYVMPNFVTGKEEPLPNNDPSIPTEAWIEGWEAYMEYGHSVTNPYGISDANHQEWEDGWTAAKEN
jgi:hypothetical protein